SPSWRSWAPPARNRWPTPPAGPTRSPRLTSGVPDLHAGLVDDAAVADRGDGDAEHPLTRRVAAVLGEGDPVGGRHPVSDAVVHVAATDVAEVGLDLVGARVDGGVGRRVVAVEQAQGRSR